MTRLYMKQKVFSLRDRFTVKDASKQDRYYVEGKLFTIGKKLYIYDMAGHEAAFVQQKVLAFLPKFYVYVNGVQVAEIVKELTFLRPRYQIKGPGWRVKGNFWEHDYEITDASGRSIVSVHIQDPLKDNRVELSGIVELDETFVLESQKGTRMPELADRPDRKHGAKTGNIQRICCHLHRHSKRWRCFGRNCEHG